MKIALSTDHAGLELLKRINQLLISKGHECIDFGPQELNPADDYPDFITPAAQAVSSGQCEVGIILGGSGQGEAIAANRVPGVRCALYYGPATAVEAIDASGTTSTDQFDILRLSRQHNHANVLSLAARFLNWEDMQKALTIWLETPYSDEERHVRRVKKLG